MDFKEHLGNLLREYYVNSDIILAYLFDCGDITVAKNSDRSATAQLNRNAIELKARKNGFPAERVLYYWAEMYAEKFESGRKYEELEQTFSVNILGFNYTKAEEYHSSYSILEDKRYEKLTDKLSIHLFELPKVPKELISGDKKQMWMELIRADENIDPSFFAKSGKSGF
ncbi:MAG: Rpn family recombination-promoting nuclease/putative transposase [Ruminococcus sp.]|nr:Rpn family recombination-promoting nuclease/putative transposase [Ruminococcus sp.]